MYTDATYLFVHDATMQRNTARTGAGVYWKLSARDMRVSVLAKAWRGEVEHTIRLDDLLRAS